MGVRLPNELTLSASKGSQGSATMARSEREGVMADVFTVMAADRAEVKAILKELENGPAKATEANQDQLNLRKRRHSSSRPSEITDPQYAPGCYCSRKRRMVQVFPGGRYRDDSAARPGPL